jgi:hypothetical protein
MRLLIILSFLCGLTACATGPKSCEQLAWEAAGQALSSTIYQQEEYMGWVAMKNSSDLSGATTGTTQDHDWFETGESSGPRSMTSYRGLSSREAFDKTMKTCMAAKQ